MQNSCPTHPPWSVVSYSSGHFQNQKPDDDDDMSWLKRLWAWWRGPAAPPPRTFTDPLDYALQYCLHPPPGCPGAGPGTWQAAFPTLTTAEADAVQQQLLALQELATDLGSRVNRQLLAGPAAYDWLWAAFPQLDRGNLNTLLWRAFVGTR